jgi:hypothetical protein
MNPTLQYIQDQRAAFLFREITRLQLMINVTYDGATVFRAGEFVRGTTLEEAMDIFLATRSSEAESAVKQQTNRTE